MKNSITKDEERHRQHNAVICGVDEAGRGAWAGPLVAAACIMPLGLTEPLAKDSKQMNATTRSEAYEQIIKQALAFAIIEIEPQRIDKEGLNPMNAEAMRRAAQECARKIDEDVFYVFDQSPDSGIRPMEMLSKAETHSHAVACASVLAKVHRDRRMIELGVEFPNFDFADHKGYITQVHRDEVDSHGRQIGLHRFSYTVGLDTTPLGRHLRRLRETS